MRCNESDEADRQRHGIIWRLGANFADPEFQEPANAYDIFTFGLTDSADTLQFADL